MPTLLYGVLVLAALDSIIRGRLTVLFALALFFPLLQAMPTPAGTVSAPANIILLGLGFLAFFHSKDTGNRGSPVPLRTPLTIIVLAVVASLLVRGWGHLTGTEYIGTFLDATKATWYWFTPFVIYILAYRLIQTREIADRVVLYCQVSAAAEAAVTLYERALGYGRATAHLREANVAGAYFAGVTVFFLAWFLYGTGRRKWLYFGGFLLGVIGVFNSLSRGGMLATAAASLIVLFLFYFRERGKVGTKALVVILLLLAALNFSVLIPEHVKERVLFTFGQGNPERQAAGELDQSSEERLLFWTIAWNHFKENPAGEGAFTFPTISARYHRKGMQTHNVYMQVLVEGGVQGFVALVVFVISVGFTIFRARSWMTSPQDKALALGIFGWWTAHVAAHLFVNCFFLLAVTGHFWLLSAAMFSLARKRFGTGDSQPAEPSPPAVVQLQILRPRRRAPGERSVTRRATQS